MSPWNLINWYIKAMLERLWYSINDKYIGDGYKFDNEECDDGNLVIRDGCS